LGKEKGAPGRRRNDLLQGEKGVEGEEILQGAAGFITNYGQGRERGKG